MNVLLVEDDPQLEKLLTRLLSKVFDNVQVATNLPDALEFANSSAYNFDLCVTDYWLKADTAMELVKALLKDERDIPIILISGGKKNVALDRVMAAAVAKGVCYTLQKPFKNEELLRAISEVGIPIDRSNASL